MLLSFIVLMSLSPATNASGQATAVGKSLFTERCAACHGLNAAGGTYAASILPRLAVLDDASLEGAIRDGVPARGMPAFALQPTQMTALVAYLRTLRASTPRARRERLEPLHVQTTTGEALDGVVISQSFEDLQLRLPDGSIRLFRRAGNRFRPVTSETDWPSYDGDVRGYRSTTLSEIDPGNVARLAPFDLYRC